MSKDDVLFLMRSSETQQEWNDNCDKVKAAFGGRYPEWWFREVICAGVLSECDKKWRSRGE